LPNTKHLVRGVEDNSSTHHFGGILLSPISEAVNRTMSFSPASLRLLRQQLRTFELSARRSSKSNIHANTRPRCPLATPASNTSHLPRRSFTTYATPTEKFRAAILKARQQYPILLPILFFTTVSSLSVLGLLAYDQYTKVDPLFADWPAPVENQLRIALHFTHVDPNPNQAAESFDGALAAAEKCGMDPFSKEVMGIRIRLAEMLEQFGRAKSSIEVLNSLAKDCQEKLTELSRGTVLKELKGENASTQEEKDLAQHTTILKTIIQVKVKIAGLYDSEFIQDPASAKKTLSEAVGLLVQHTQDPQAKGFHEDNAAGLSLEEIAAMLSQMGDLYATTGEEANAIQVYMLTLDPLRKACNGTKSCKEVQILSNIAASMGIAAKRPGAVINGRPATPESKKAARRAAIKWADQAIGTAEKVLPEDRDEICELGMLSAQLTKADLLLEDGQKVESKELWRGMLPILREKNLTSLISTAEQGIRRADA
jgi:hypothetical protein